MRIRILAAAAALLFGLNVSLAADKGGTSKIAAPPAAQAQDTPQWNRAGAYVGVIGAYDIAVLEAEGLDLASGKLMAGAMAGYNFRAGPHFMWGVEADWLFTGVSASSGSEGFSVKYSTNHLISARLRAGVPLGPALIYATAGPAWQQSKVTISGEGSETAWQLGAAFGAGAEVELTRTVFVRLEALHYIFPADGAPMSEFMSSDNQHTTARVAVGFKLN